MYKSKFPENHKVAIEDFKENSPKKLEGDAALKWLKSNRGDSSTRYLTAFAPDYLEVHVFPYLDEGDEQAAKKMARTVLENFEAESPSDILQTQQVSFVIHLQDKLKEELVGKSTSMILNAENADFRDNEEAEKARAKEMAKDKAEQKVPGMPHKEGFKRYQPLSEELIDDSKSTVKDSIGGDFTMQDKEKKEKKEESTSRYKSPFMENEDDLDDISSPGERVVASWINGNKKSVVQEIKKSKGEKSDNMVSALAEHLAEKGDVSDIRSLILMLLEK